ncbi:MAG: PAS domain S-box protein [Sideroxyarcus sp.]
MLENVFLPHGYCISWQPWLTAALVLGNLLIAMAYFTIPLVILRFIRQRRDIDFRSLHWLFAGFIVSCGITHMLHVVELWYPVYYLEAAMDILTGVISLIAAIALWKLLPVFVSLPSTHQLQTANEELKRMREALRESEVQLHGLGDSLPDSYLYQYTLEGDKPKFIYISSGVERVNGIKAEAAMHDATVLLEQIEPQQREPYAAAQAISQRELSDFSMELHILSANGTWRWMQVKSHPFKNKDGKIVWNGVATDVTDRHLLETEINRLAQAIEQNPTGILITDTQGTPVFMNEACTRISGYMIADFYAKSRTMRELISTEMSDAEYTAVQSRLQSGKTWSGVLRNRHKSGKLYWEQITVSHIYDSDGKVASYLFLRSDVTEQMNAESTRTQLAAIVESSNDAIIGKTPDGIVTTWNRGAEKMYGYIADEIIGKSVMVLAPPWLHAEILEFHKTLRNGGFIVNHETERIRKDGVTIQVALTLSPIMDMSGKVTGISTIARDITERKRAEQEIYTLNHELEQRVSERTAQLEAANRELEAFSYSVSHDLRTPLRAIDGFSHILLDDYANKLDDEGKRLIKIVRNNTNRMGQLIDDILQFSRTGRIEINYSSIDMENMAREVLEELQSLIPGGVKPQVEIEHIPPVRGDRAMMRQVFMNLLSNAIKFSRTRESPVVRVGGSIKGDEAVYYVKDNGVGFNMQSADKLFGVFQRLHSMNEFEGTGIGLAIVKRIVTRHGGRVWAESELEEGATIYFALPTKEIDHE